MADDRWLDNAESMLLFSPSGDGADATKLLEIGPVNRTIRDDDQAYNLMVLRMMAHYYKSLEKPRTDNDGNITGPVPFEWINQAADLVESYQQTMEGETNSRVQYMKVAMSQVKNILSEAKQHLGDLMK